MTKRILLLAFMLLLTAWFVGCEKTTTTTSSEFHEIVGQNQSDTVFVHDTVFSNNGNPTTVYDTTFVHDTVVQTVTQVDTVTIQSSGPTVYTAFTAMQAYTDAQVIADVNATVGYTDGWVLYLSAYQSYIDNPSTNVWDLAGYIDYWSPDFSDFYAYEYGWRVSYVSGDPGDPNNWQFSDIPAGAPNGANGLKRVDKPESRKTVW